jgi:hypothetical protein
MEAHPLMKKGAFVFAWPSWLVVFGLSQKIGRALSREWLQGVCSSLKSAGMESLKFNR